MDHKHRDMYCAVFSKFDMEKRSFRCRMTAFERGSTTRGTMSIKCTKLYSEYSEVLQFGSGVLIPFSL